MMPKDLLVYLEKGDMTEEDLKRDRSPELKEGQLISVDQMENLQRAMQNSQYQQFANQMQNSLYGQAIGNFSPSQLSTLGSSFGQDPRFHY